MPEPIDYALFAANSYAATMGGPSNVVSSKNETPIPSGTKGVSFELIPS